MPPDSRFDRFKGHWCDASFLDEKIEGEPVWENPGDVRTRDIYWQAFLSGVLFILICAAASRSSSSHGSAAGVRLVRRSQDAPSYREVAEQLARLRSAAERLAAVAQGGRPRSRASPEPAWWRYDADDVYRKHIELGLRVQDGRSQFLHPLLQDHLTIAMLPEAYSIVPPEDPGQALLLRRVRGPDRSSAPAERTSPPQSRASRRGPRARPGLAPGRARCSR